MGDAELAQAAAVPVAPPVEPVLAAAVEDYIFVPCIYLASLAKRYLGAFGLVPPTVRLPRQVPSADLPTPTLKPTVKTPSRTL